MAGCISSSAASEKFVNDAAFMSLRLIGPGEVTAAGAGYLLAGTVGHRGEESSHSDRSRISGPRMAAKDAHRHREPLALMMQEVIVKAVRTVDPVREPDFRLPIAPLKGGCIRPQAVG